MVTARIGCRAMPAATGYPVADFWADNSDWVTAALAILLAFLAATLLDRYFARRGDKLAAAVSRGEVSPVLDTRLRFFRRLIYAVILLVGIAVRAVAVHRPPKAGRQPARLGRARRRDHRLRRPPGRSPTRWPGSCSPSRSRCGSATG